MELREKLVVCLIRNNDIYALSSCEVIGIAPSVMEHRLNIHLGSWLVRQKKRSFTPAQDKVTHEAVTRLMEAGYILEVQFPF